MKLGPVTKLDRRNKLNSRKFDNDVMFVDCEVIVSFSIYGIVGAIQKLNCGCLVCKIYLLSYINCKEN